MSDVRPMPIVRVFTSGTEREALSVGIERQIPSLGAGHLGVPGGLMATTADATLIEPQDVTRRAKRSPWDRVGNFPPRDGDRADITVDGNQRFTGWVEDADGGAYQNVSTSMVGVFERLRGKLTIDPLSNLLPHSLDERGVAQLAYIALRPEWYVYLAMREAGFMPVQPPHAQAKQFIPMAGSLFAEDGSLPTGFIHVAERLEMSWMPAPWGMAVSGVSGDWRAEGLHSGNAEYVLYVTGPPIATESMEVRYVETLPAQSRYHLRLSISFPEPGQIMFSVPESGTTATVDRDDALAVKMTQTSNGWYVQYGDEQVLQGTSSMSGDFSHISVVSPEGCQVHLGPLYAGEADQTVDNEAVPNASIRCGGLLTGRPLRAGPYLENISAIDLLQEIAHAQAASLLIDRDNHLHYAHPDVLEAQDPSLTLTTDADLLDLSWSLSSRDIASRVQVSHRDPTVLATRRDQVVLYQGTSRRPLYADDVIDNTYEFEGWATPDSNVDWLAHDATSPDRWTTIHAVSSSAFRGFNRGGTWWGTCATLENNDEITITTLGQHIASMDMERVTSQAIKYRMTLISPLSTIDSVDTRIASTKFFESDEDLYVFRGQGLPIIRGTGHIAWEDARTASEITGPEAAVEMDHTAGPWVQDEDVQILADWLAARTTHPRPLIQELPIVWRDDLDLGQVITLVEDQVYDIRLTCLVIGLRERHTPDSGAQMWVTLRVLDGEGLDHLYSFGEAAFGAGPYGGNRP